MRAMREGYSGFFIFKAALHRRPLFWEDSDFSQARITEIDYDGDAYSDHRSFELRNPDSPLPRWEGNKGRVVKT